MPRFTRQMGQCVFSLIVMLAPAWAEPASDASWAPYTVRKPAEADAIDTTSFYLTMRDGVRIAVTTYLPATRSATEKLPTIMLATRYYRAFQGAPPDAVVRTFVANGYAYVAVDARGSGASFGQWPAAWAPEEIKDYGEVLDWIVRQRWSNGAVGMHGVSYNGTTAEMTAALGHPALKAVAPEFSAFDTLTEVARPGGIFLSSFLKWWTDINHAQDSNQFELQPLRVDSDTDGSLLAAAVAEHRYNANAHLLMSRIRYRGDIWDSVPSLQERELSPYGHIEAFHKAGIPFYGISGWYDGGFAPAAIKRFLTVKTPGSKLTLGPWSHGGDYDNTPGRHTPSQFDRTAELIRFFDTYLKQRDTGVKKEAPVHYYTMVEGRWKSAQNWPPAAKSTPFYLASDQGLAETAPGAASGEDGYAVDYTVGTGGATRWESLGHMPQLKLVVTEESSRKRLLYASRPLSEDMEVTGHPELILYLSSDQADGQFFVYLEDVAPDGRVSRVTEGLLRGLHRKIGSDAPYRQVGPYYSFTREDAKPMTPGAVEKLHIGLLPTSYLFRRGHAIRVALAGADADHFELPLTAPANWQVQRNSQYPSRLLLPVVE